MTLRTALMMINLDKVYKLINKKDNKYIGNNETIPLESTINSYSTVVKELLSKPKTKSCGMPWCVKEEIDSYDKKKFLNVYLRNPKYINPPKGLSPWGGKNPPKGCYNVNLDKYSPTFSAGFTSWSKLIDNSIDIEECSVTLERVVAEILWELTFYGWTEKSINTFKKKILGDVKKIKKQINLKKSVKKK
jgi:hypothetical protein